MTLCESRQGMHSNALPIAYIWICVEQAQEQGNEDGVQRQLLEVVQPPALKGAQEQVQDNGDADHGKGAEDLGILHKGRGVSKIS